MTDADPGTILPHSGAAIAVISTSAGEMTAELVEGGLFDGGRCMPGQPIARNLKLSYGGAWAKAFGQLLNFNCALILYPILRYILRACNNYRTGSGKQGISKTVPLRRNIDFHKLIAVVVGLCTFGHVMAHFLNYGKSPDATSVRFHWHSDDGCVDHFP